MKRILEPESMDNLEEAIEYDKLVSDKQGNTLDECFAKSVTNMGVPKGDILDIGTGTGRIPIKILQNCPFYQITAIDLSENMLSVAQENKERSETDESLIFVKTDAKVLPFYDNSFDLVYSHVTFHHIPDPVPVLKEVNRVLKPEGALIIRDLKRPRNKVLLSLYVSIFGKEYDSTQKKLYRDSLMAGFNKNEFENMVKQANIDNVRIQKYFITHLGIERKAKEFQLTEPPYKMSYNSNAINNLMQKKFITN